MRSLSNLKILPAACPDLSHDHLTGVADGAMAVEAYKEAVRPETTPERKAEIEKDCPPIATSTRLGW